MKGKSSAALPASEDGSADGSLSLVVCVKCAPEREGNASGGRRYRPSSEKREWNRGMTPPLACGQEAFFVPDLAAYLLIMERM